MTDNNFESAEKNFSRIKEIITPFFNFAINTTVFGSHHLRPSGKLIITSNHRCDMDPFVISYAYPRIIHWVAADYSFKIPIFKDLIAKTGVIPMATDGTISMGSIKKIQQVFKRGETLGIFPEGHDYLLRNDFNAPMSKFHDGFASFALRGEVDILPAVIMPVEETVSDYPIAPFIRNFFGMPKDVSEIKQRVTYKKVNVIFGKIISTKDFLHLPPDEAPEKLCEFTRVRMQELQDLNRFLV